MKLRQYQWEPPETWKRTVEDALATEREQFPYKIVVVDDDPTGTQTVYGVCVFTDWEEESLVQGLTGPEPMFYILTNSRSFSSERTKREHTLLAQRLERASRRTGVEYLLISRGDSTLRGHYPIETLALKVALEADGIEPFDGEILIPVFPEGERYTIENSHYIANNGVLVPVGESEFARDPTFGYKQSDLGRWIEEKTAGTYHADQVTYLSLEQMRQMDFDGMQRSLERVSNFGKVVVNAVSYWDLRSFTVALMRSIYAGKRFLFRTAAAFPKVLADVTDKPMLERSELQMDDAGGLVVVGSHVDKTTRQIEHLLTDCNICQVIFNQHCVLNTKELREEVERALEACEACLRKKKTVVLMTRRERLDLNTGNKEDELVLAERISEALSEIVSRLQTRPSYLVAKGGITSSDIATKGLGVKRGIVLGQILPGIPVWRTGEESRFPGIPYIVFPGNVGSDETLSQVVALLSARKSSAVSQ